MSEFADIPVIDVSAIHGDDAVAKQNLAQEFAKAYGETGFGYIKNHGISTQLQERVFAASARFHNADHATKMAVELNRLHRGFIPINTSTDVNSKLADVKKPNQSESFMVMREDAADAPPVLAGDYLAGPNQWPDQLPDPTEFRADVMAYHDGLAELANSLLEIVELSVGADPGDLTQHFDLPTTWLRLLYYPPTDPMAGSGSDGDLFGSAPHTDFGCLTILAQDDIGGLQVQTPAGNWVNAPRIEGTFVVNVGDMLHRWSNGLLRSTPHRVINSSGKSRYSCPFFYDPNVATMVAPLAATVSPQRPAQFEPLNFGAFLRSELEAGYQKHKQN
ncbi:MAG: isopenicillin N synthase family oxygenase [Rhizobiaceae bacterium]|nr:isopenicillin N synthase family oxygenase [Rhizobiaceae bacterium]